MDDDEARTAGPGGSPSAKPGRGGAAGVIHRSADILLAAACFLLMLAFPPIALGGSVELALALSRILGGSDLAARTAEYLSRSPNTLSLMMYAATAVPVLAWARCLRRRRGGTPRGAAWLARTLPERIAAAGKAVVMAAAMWYLVDVILLLYIVAAPQLFEGYSTMMSDAGAMSYGAIWLVSTAVLPPIVEETAFRGIGMGYLRSAGLPFWVANALQAAAFGAFHGNLIQGTYTFVLGFALGWLTGAYGSVVPSICMHAAFNLMGTIGTGLMGSILPGPGVLSEAVLGIALLVLAVRLVGGPGAGSVPAGRAPGALPAGKEPTGAGGEDAPRAAEGREPLE